MWHRDRGGNTGAESQRDRSYLGKQMTEVGRSQRALIHGQERASAKARRQDGAWAQPAGGSGRGWHQRAMKEARAGPCRPLTSSFPFRLSKLVKKRKPSLPKPFSSTMRADGFPSLGRRPERVVRAHFTVLAATPLPRRSPHLRPLILRCLGMQATHSPPHPRLGICPRGAGMTSLPGTYDGLSCVSLKF